jgi:hypothetical protein
MGRGRRRKEEGRKPEEDKVCVRVCVCVWGGTKIRGGGEVCICVCVSGGLFGLSEYLSFSLSFCCRIFLPVLEREEGQRHLVDRFSSR